MMWQVSVDTIVLWIGYLDEILPEQLFNFLVIGLEQHWFPAKLSAQIHQSTFCQRAMV